MTPRNPPRRLQITRSQERVSRYQSRWHQKSEILAVAIGEIAGPLWFSDGGKGEGFRIRSEGASEPSPEIDGVP